MKKILLIIALITLAVGLHGCKSKKTDAPNSTDSVLITDPENKGEATVAVTKADKKNNQYTDKELNFSLTFPNEWTYNVNEKLVINPGSGLDPIEVGKIVFLKPEANGFANLSLVIETEHENNVNLENYTNVSIERLEQQIQKFELTTQEETTVAGNTAQKITYIGEFNGQTLQWMQIYALKDNNVYLYTFTDNTDTFAANLEKVESTINSMKFN